MTIQGLSKCNTQFSDFPVELQQEIRECYKAFGIEDPRKERWVVFILATFTDHMPKQHTVHCFHIIEFSLIFSSYFAFLVSIASKST
jgi:hypothetical protein